MSTKDDLIEAAKALLWEKGYVGTSPRDIQKRANAGQGSMYHHFSGKEELALAAIMRSAEELKALAEKEAPADGSAYERIRACILRERNILSGCPMGKLVQDPDVMSSEKLRAPVSESFDWAVSRIEKIFLEGIRSGEFADADARAVASMITSTIQGAYVLARAANSEKPYRDAIRGLEAALAALRIHNK
jgi:AcrR family transcriptional regulator